MTTTDHRAEVLAFAARFPTPNVQAAVRHAEAGRLTWEQVYDLSVRALGTALTQVQR